jgi:hypothetical protein
MSATSPRQRASMEREQLAALLLGGSETMK